MYKDMTGIFYSCDNCRYDGMQHFDEPCEDCTPNHCGYDPLSNHMNEPEDFNDDTRAENKIP